MELARIPCWLRGRGAFGCCWLLLLLTSFTVADNEWWHAVPVKFTNASVDQSTKENVDFRRDIASQLEDLTRQIRNEAKRLSGSILLELNKIVSELDPRFALSTGSLLIERPLVPDVCDDIFNGSIHARPWYNTSFVESSTCNRDEKQPISKLVTVLLFDRQRDINKTFEVLETIFSYNPDIKVILGSTTSIISNKMFNDKYKNIDTVTIDYEGLLYPGKILNLMVQRIQSPYVLIARDIFYLNNLARLERQVFVISSTNVLGVAGGAFRNETGYWKVGCYLSRIKNYFLKFTEGYKYSALDCMLCDHLEGPFVARASVMRDVPFKENLYEEVVFEDWFLRLKQKNILTMNCPDAMYFKRGPVEGVLSSVKLREHFSWLGLAREWQVVNVQYPYRISIKFTCTELRITCDPRRWFKAFLTPPCCLERATEALKALDSFSKKKVVDYEINSGTSLGAVKLRNFLPWDVDGNINFLRKDYEIYYENRDYFSKNEFNLSHFKEKEYFKLNTPGMMLEMTAANQTSRFLLPNEMFKYPTRVKMDGIWVRGNSNPGLYVRNRYGPAFLKHVQHWRALNMSDAWQRYNPGSWLPCPKRAHHGCLDQYPADGSVDLIDRHCA